MHLLRCATFTTPDVGAATRRLVEAMGYGLVEQGLVDRALARAWAAPGAEGRPFSLCRPASGAPGHVRFVEGPPAPDFRALRTFGWAAAELCVEDVLAAHERLKDGPFEVIGPPMRVDGLPTIFPMQVRGPDQEIIYLTEILNNAADSGLPQGARGIDKPFILVLACSDLEATSDWFRRQLGLAVGRPVSIAYDLINAAFGFPLDRHHRLATAKWNGEVCLEFDQYPPEATPRPGAPGQLPPGLSICSLVHPAMDDLPGDWLTPPGPLPGLLYGGATVGVLRAPDGGLIEVIDMA